MLTKSQTFQIYNVARRAPKLDAQRVNRALGLLMRKDQSWREKYEPTITSCKCEDRYFTKSICKHMVAIMIEVKWQRTHNETRKIKVWGKTYDARRLVDASLFDWELEDYTRSNFCDEQNNILTGRGLVSKYNFVQQLKRDGWKFKDAKCIEQTNGATGWNGRFEITMERDK